MEKLKGASKEERNDILDGDASNINTQGHKRRLKDLLKGRFKLTKYM
jgi:hypothetical protein